MPKADAHSTHALSLFQNLSVIRLLDIAAALFASLVLLAIAVMVTIQ